jgi:AraC family transcriptional regulator, regulatory protein of adaptative response / methylated-DNA-[protein]-cysteine methyltransferase
LNSNLEVRSERQSLPREARIRATMSRNPSYDGLFVFSVATREVYCRPSCPSRRPAVEKLRFYVGPEEAESLGLRECLRCKPRSAGPALRSARLVRSVCDYIQRNLEGDLSLKQLGVRFKVSPFHLQRVFKTVMGVSPRKYAEESRIARLKAELSRGETVSGALRRTGYRSQSWLYADSGTKLGMTPGTYRRGGEGEVIAYSIGDSPIGRLLVAVTERGICGIDVGETDRELIETLHKEYPRAAIARTAESERFLHGVMSYFSGQQVSLPLDLRGTPFQLKVWSALQTIPMGATCSYSDLAKMIGDPAAVRAVANACASNPVPLIVPCHRVVRKNGGLGGYGLGVGRKRALLRHEQRESRER